MNLFRVNQSFLFLLSAVFLAEKQQIYQCYSIWFDPIGIRIHDLYCLRGEHANHYTTDAVYLR
jgi:hypothetical protein